ncbi:9516_t:CDS:2 [Diversispora eburnea]|uniref:9516_t:CDS:1 n=1 Tax=Diversispora eburnea TaxID=1213867 RepID=A0A9N8VMI6_9GLOM|nr:9516_t:CDS:2 [Diversispora eburnea]
MEKDKPSTNPMVHEIEVKAEDIKKKLKHVETQEKSILPTKEDIEQEKKDDDKNESK